jgi:hypothetical protein
MTVRTPMSVHRVRQMERERSFRAERRRARIDFLIGVIGVLVVITIAVFAAQRTGLLHRAQLEIRQLRVFGNAVPFEAPHFSGIT